MWHNDEHHYTLQPVPPSFPSCHHVSDSVYFHLGSFVFCHLLIPFLPTRLKMVGELKTTQILFQTIIQCLVEHNNIVILLMNSDHHKWQVTAFNLGVKDGKFTDKKSACTVKCTEYDFTLVTLSFLHESPYTDTFSHGRAEHIQHSSKISLKIDFKPLSKKMNKWERFYLFDIHFTRIVNINFECGNRPGLGLESLKLDIWKFRLLNGMEKLYIFVPFYSYLCDIQ